MAGASGGGAGCVQMVAQAAAAGSGKRAAAVQGKRGGTRLWGGLGEDLK